MRLFTLLVAVILLVSACTDEASSGDAVADNAGQTAEAAAEYEDLAFGRALVSPDDAQPADLASDSADGSDTDALAFEAEDDDRTAETNGAPATDSEADPSASDPPADAEAPIVDAAADPLDRMVAELVAFVEAERGLTFDQTPDVQVLDSAPFLDAWTQVIENDVASNAEEYAEYTDIYRALGILGSSDTLEEIWLRFGDAGVIGFYDTDTKQIVLRSGELSTFTELVLVHELVHALEDQEFGLDRDAEHRSRDDEISWAFSALVEGSARTIEDRYRATLSQAELDEAAAASAAIPRGVSLAEFSTAFLELQFGRYRYGQSFAESLWTTGGQAAVDAALIDPPAISEAIIDPAVYAAGQVAPLNLPAPPADGEVFESGVWGEAGFAALLADTLGVDAALTAVDGWGVDRFVAWRQGTQVCVRMHVAADTPEALDGYATALEEWALGGTREIFYPTADLVRLTGCA